jgi:hypothetical protein
VTVTPLQSALVSLYLLIEDARDELDPEGFAAFIWIGADRFSIEAARLVVFEALEATEEAA